jgi:hypothetical protein
MAERIHIGGITNSTLHIETDGTMHVEDKLDVQNILDANAAERNQRFSAASPDGDFYGHARIDLVTLHRWADEAGIPRTEILNSLEFAYVMEKKLLDPENAKFLIAPKVRDPRVIIKGAR